MQVQYYLDLFADPLDEETLSALDTPGEEQEVVSSITDEDLARLDALLQEPLPEFTPSVSQPPGCAASSPPPPGSQPAGPTAAGGPGRPEVRVAGASWLVQPISMHSGLSV